MSAHLHCARCGRHPWLELRVEIGADGKPQCTGDDCAEWAASLRIPPELAAHELRPIIHREAKAGTGPVRPG